MPPLLALFLLRTPRLFIEAKGLGAHIDDGKWASQILAYATIAGVEWVALTDGDEWRIYNSHAAVPVEQKLFRVVRVSDPLSEADATLMLLAKAHMSDHLCPYPQTNGWTFWQMSCAASSSSARSYPSARRAALGHKRR